MRAGPSSPFPIALYAALVLALFALSSRERFLGIEQRLRGFVVMPLRAYAAVGSEARAADHADATRAARRQELGRDLADRLARASAALPNALVPAGCEPFVCRVAEPRKAPLEKLPSSLVLDVAPDDAARCLPFVTYGEHLVGFLEALDEGTRVGVALLHRTNERGAAGATPRRLAAEFAIDVDGSDRMRCLVEPARASEPWLLRCVAVEDPYRAASIVAGGAVVRTASDEASPDAPPPGLVIGELRVRGFEHQGRAVPIGLYVRPRMQPLGISTVTLWRRTSPVLVATLADPATALRKSHHVHPTSLLELPAPPPVREAWFLATAGGLRLARGAGVLSDGALVGLVQSSGSGYAVAVPIGAPAPWSLLWMPEEPEKAPVDLVCRSVGREDDVVTFEIVGDEVALPQGGTMWSGAMGPHCPAGLPIGVVVSSDAASRRVRVQLEGSLHGPFTALARRGSVP